MITKTETCTECGKDIEVELITISATDWDRVIGTTEFDTEEYNFVCIGCAVDRMGEE